MELFDIVLTLHGLGTFAEELSNCIEVPVGRQKLKVLAVERILVSKRAANLAKDRLVIPVLEDSLAASKVSVERSTKKQEPKKPKTAK